MGPAALSLRLGVPLVTGVSMTGWDSRLALSAAARAGWSARRGESLSPASLAAAAGGASVSSSLMKDFAATTSGPASSCRSGISRSGAASVTSGVASARVYCSTTCAWQVAWEVSKSACRAARAPAHGAISCSYPFNSAARVEFSQSCVR